jgi:tRNA1(Val) A37 N6-methylase TrmN6
MAHGNKLTVDDFICAWVAAEEMRKRGYGLPTKKNDAVRASISGEPMFGMTRPQSDDGSRNTSQFTHADLGTGCGSVLMTIAWAFCGQVRSVGVEAQTISFGLLRRGLEWNLGIDGTRDGDTFRILKEDLRTWNGGIETRQHEEKGEKMSLHAPFQLITGTPPYFPLDSFVPSENHNQKVRCRIPTRGGASSYIETASRLLSKDNGVFCMVEAAFDKAASAVLHTAQTCRMKIHRRLDVITRAGLPPRFSCWVMVKMKEDEDSRVNDFLVESFTLRNSDFTRTKEYSSAMEVMGWVDFEQSNNRPGKTFLEEQPIREGATKQQEC